MHLETASDQIHLPVPNFQINSSDLITMRGYRYSSSINGIHVDIFV